MLSEFDGIDMFVGVTLPNFEIDPVKVVNETIICILLALR